jgi:hypothetical protein
VTSSTSSCQGATSSCQGATSPRSQSNKDLSATSASKLGWSITARGRACACDRCYLPRARESGGGGGGGGVSEESLSRDRCDLRRARWASYQVCCAIMACSLSLSLSRSLAAARVCLCVYVCV